MGRKKQGFNWKARQNLKTVIDKSEQNKIKVELSESGNYDECNALALPSKKRQTKVKKETLSVQRILSKSQRKKLEKIVAKKKKKENRNELLEKLSQVQVSDSELSRLTTLSAIQTKGLKRRWDEDKVAENVALPSEKPSMAVNAIKGSKKKLRLLALSNDIPAKLKKKDPNVVGFEESSEESEEDEPENKETTPAEETQSDDKETIEVTGPENPVALVLSDDENLSVPVKADAKDCSKVVVKKEKDEHQLPVKREPAVFVSVDRSKEIQEARLRLPILGEEQEIMEAIHENPVVVIAGETGSGKTTQVPQFLYEAGYTRNGKMIGVTEPRRVAAISMSQRVGYELGMTSDRVSYLIRFEGNVTPKTEIKFMTDGVLLKEIQSDFVLSKYSVIILDEAHERSVYTDILVGLLSRIVPLRAKRGDPLKLIIMSATLRVSDFTENKVLFKVPPPVIKVESRQFPVTVHFNKRTNPDYMREAFRKVCRIHTQLPEGGILVFVTGQQEVNLLIRKLRSAFPKSKHKPSTSEKTDKDSSTPDKDESGDEEDLTLTGILEKVRKKRKKCDTEVKLPEINLDSYESVPQDDTEADLVDYDSDGVGDDEEWETETPMISAEPLWVLPLYSLLPSYKQAKVFQSPPDGYRLCVVATNVAETSLTIPGIKYVVDTGKVKTRLYDKTTGVTSFTVVWESKAGANQRAGRAGRTSPGHCYRLFSSAIFNDEFEDWSVPEMQRRGVDDLMLQMKSLGIDKVANFPFPSPPDREQLKAAESRLTLLGALRHAKGKEKDCCGVLTELGTSMAAFPVAPRFAKMLCLSARDELMPYTIAAVAALSVQEFLIVGDDNRARAVWRSWAGRNNSLALGDIMVLLRGICGGEYAATKGELTKFCLMHGLREKAVIEARKIRVQLTNEINLSKPDLNLIVDPLLKPPSDSQAKMLRQIFLCGLVDHVARKNIDPHETKGTKRATYRTPEMEDDVYIHSSCALYKKQPEWVVYQEIYETNKMYMRGVTEIDPEWLPVFAPSMCTLSPPLELPPPRYDEEMGLLYCHVNGTFGRSAWELPVVEIEFPQGLDKYKWFASFFLDGEVCPRLKKYKRSLLNPPHTMTKSWAKLVARTESMLKFLALKEVDSRLKLFEAWEEDPKYLLDAYLEWLPESARTEVTQMWPPK